MSLTDAELLAGFRDATLPAFSHRDHVRAAWLYLRERPFEEAHSAFGRDLGAFAAARGAGGLFHATITWAFFVLIDERRRPDEPFDAFAARHPELFQREPSPLARHYTPERLASAEARARVVMPDRVAFSGCSTPPRATRHPLHAPA